ncbi:hypothetical protein CEXT_423761 [Caerostris extrusa]|uniref:Uncharacterized protein n=1 Tax=Caerostris extrusa TaxID=172846 RepID=A0AAV4XYJ8_CAEEX|nr:hypothetical protein CEXT_423761 [Caerostris extrusa]
MVLQYQTLSQGSDPEEQPLGSRVPFSIFFPFSSNSCVTQWFRIHQRPATVKMDCGEFPPLFIYFLGAKTCHRSGLCIKKWADFPFQNILSLSD